MPLGRQKRDVRGVCALSGTELPFVVTAPQPRRSNVVVVAHLLRLTTGLPTANETIEQFGNASTRGYRLEVLTSGAVRMTAYRAGPASTSVSSTNLLTAADADKLFVAIGIVTSGTVQVYLNDTSTAAALGGAMVIQAAPAADGTGGDNRYICAQDAAGTGRINRVRPVQNVQVATAFPGVLNLGELFARTREALRLEEIPGCSSYIDFGRYSLDVTTAGVPTGQPFGDDVTGARVAPVGAPYLSPWSARADRDEDWSEA